jgi:hypothetical protein
VEKKSFFKDPELNKLLEMLCSKCTSQHHSVFMKVAKHKEKKKLLSKWQAMPTYVMSVKFRSPLE